MKKIFLIFIKVYRVIWPFLQSGMGFKSNCIFVPSCSRYMEEAVSQMGVVKGSWVGLKRLARCHPFGSPRDR
ncbi:MAG: hypothetical protein A3I11_06025 [Elusimicrobia bacterium RIFCSPLOWO2_02_FULL_39_32]|nr:MAG: hypothetical protein A2034_03400 [Elusimicrobia bacterium GWA2_38_7]OGR80691.1 MAG: hypothetical protein A3B80_04205 [Elusimicrobia bacterium RIFCSPHIGHO2_02_FULL_39_36]OGR91539.1 MAG: hypothetical protein A3I11_06025 [Elusimicrobia bacterium RIFCSPLOWO2_02_FULL_39_32]OGS00793.1 MAG: hypothetical protein A3G85_04620 [Elusimicrobia bacterium RIFCSPLOWO2_12_FULL_39_28]